MDMLHERATRDTLAAWTQSIAPALPTVAREDPYWEALVAAASTSEARDQRAWQRATDWLFTSVLPVLQTAVRLNSDRWETFADRRDWDSGRALLSELDAVVASAHRKAAAAGHAALCIGAPAAIAQETRAHAAWHRAVLVRRAVAIATLDRTFAGIGHVAAMAIFAGDGAHIVSDLDPIGLLATMLDDENVPSPVLFD